MRTQTFTTETVTALLRKQTVAPLDEIIEAFGSASRRTVCRKLVAAGCRSSYTHCGRYYTLDELAAYDQHGLWSYQGIGFSRAGTLLATVAALVEQAPAGRFADELGQLVQVEVQNALGKLARARHLARQKLDGRFLYCSATPQRREMQLRTRRVLLAGGSATPPLDSGEERVRQATGMLLSLLDERQRRLYAGLESLRHGRGGDGRVAVQLGMATATVAKGRQQLLAGDYQTDRVRKPGGGRKALEKKPCTDRPTRHAAPPRHRRRPLLRPALDPSHHPQPLRLSHRYPRTASLPAHSRPTAARLGLLPAREPQVHPVHLPRRTQRVVRVHRPTAPPMRPPQHADCQHRHQDMCSCTYLGICWAPRYVELML